MHVVTVFSPPISTLMKPHYHLSALSHDSNRSSKSLLANVLDIDDDFRCNHRCNTLPHNPTYYRTMFRQGEDVSLGPVGGGAVPPPVGGRLHETVSHTCLSSSAEYELALILKELRVITDAVRILSLFLPGPRHGGISLGL
jgi:hypothetical protein